jgi:hypothetical protein
MDYEGLHFLYVAYIDGNIGGGGHRLKLWVQAVTTSTEVLLDSVSIILILPVGIFGGKFALFIQYLSFENLPTQHVKC